MMGGIKVLEDGLYEVRSFTDPNKTYVVDVVERTCTCPAFIYGVRVPCKHILAALEVDPIERERRRNRERQLPFRGVFTEA